MTEENLPQPHLVAIALAVLALLAAIVPVGLWWMASTSTASFADAEVLEANHLGAASLDIVVGSDSAVLVAGNLAPGDVVSGQLEVTNAGTLPLRYGIKARTGGGLLRDWLVFELWEGENLCRPGNPIAPVVSGVKLSSTDTTLVSVGEAGLMLGPDESAVLCLGASLPLAAPNDVQGQRLDVELIIDAEHDIEADR